MTCLCVDEERYHHRLLYSNTIPTGSLSYVFVLMKNTIIVGTVQKHHHNIILYDMSVLMKNAIVIGRDVQNRFFLFLFGSVLKKMIGIWFGMSVVWFSLKNVVWLDILVTYYLHNSCIVNVQ